MRPVLILGGYGNFGKRIARALTNDGIPVTIAGRSAEKAAKLQQELQRDLPLSHVAVAVFDASVDLRACLQETRPSVVVNTCGPFQSADYTIAKTCISQAIHYIDLADGRDFVTGISGLNRSALAQGVSVISGASTVPGLSSAVAAHYQSEFAAIDEMRHGISPGQQAERGLATTMGILSYVGKPLKPFPGGGKTAYGWQDIHRQDYPGLGGRWMANCDVPDLDILPDRYGIGTIRFSAGLELGALHLGLWALGWLVRIGVPLNLPRWAGWLLKASNLFDRFGTADGGMHVVLKGKGKDGNPRTRRWFIVARHGDGPHIPTIPAIVLARDIARGVSVPKGAMPCVGLIDLDRYIDELSAFAVETMTDAT
jgi:saccharopine dehydrogenase-like protein